MIKVKSFKKLKGNSKKYEITFEKNGKMYVRKFGAAGMSDYTIHKDKERRERYISRHKKDLRTNDPMKPGYLSMYILWNKPSINASLADYKRRLNIYNKTGKFPTGITGSKKLSFGGLLDDITETEKIDRFFRDKIGLDLTQEYLHPELKANLEPGATEVLQRRGRDYLYKKNKLLEKLSNKFDEVWGKLPARGRAQRGLTKGEEWTLLDPTLVFTQRWFKKVATAARRRELTVDDIVNKKSKWNKILISVLEKMQKYEKNGDPVERWDDEGFGPKATYYENTRDYIVSILRVGGHYADPASGQWTNKALKYLKSSNNKFGTANRETDAATKISAAQRGRIARKKYLDPKETLKNMLWQINADSKDSRYADEQMKEDGTPWVVLDPRKKKTVNWLYRAADDLTLQDYKRDPLWANAIWHIVDQLRYLDPDNAQGGWHQPLSSEDKRWITAAEDNLDLIMTKMDLQTLDASFPGWYFWAAPEIKMKYPEVLGSGFEELYLEAFGKKYKVPDNVVNKKLYESIKSKIKRDVKGRRWGAYDSGRLVREYKEAGGKYKGSKGKTNLDRWYKEKWVDVCAWPKRKPCGRKTKESIAYCRPSKKVDSKTPKTVQKLTAAQRKSRCARKKKTPMKRITKFGNEKKLV